MSPFESTGSPAVEAAPATAPTRSTLRTAARRGVRGIAILALAVALVAGGVGLDRSGLLAGSPTNDAASQSAQFQLIRQAWDLLHEQDVQRASLDDTALAYGAIDGLTAAVGDTGHTTFLSPADLATEQGVLSGHYVGIGVTVGSVAKGAVIGTVFPGGSAAKAGLKAGDVIRRVNGTSVAGLAIAKLVTLIEGPSGSSVTLAIQPVTGAERSVSLVRGAVTIPVVDWRMVPGTHIADIQLDQFSSGATAALVKALGAAHAAGATGIVLDLRGNPGGYLSEAVGVASQFLGSGDVLLTQDAAGTRTATPVQTGGVALTDSLVVLVDRSTASSAEIVAGALQDAHRAIVVGEKTFGTGTVLGQFMLDDGSALRIGTSEWLTPSGRSLWHDGLVPDQVVALSSGQRPVAPADLAGLSAAKAAAVPDAQLKAALRDVGRPAA
ncbi:MAG: carboxyl-terminal processing protease [Chloroflexota bacterium]|jgi:carboxyl-terminal processing protease|nr:carboxyl-terminal processing protease [Chloroflexota bacterium]